MRRDDDEMIRKWPASKPTVNAMRARKGDTQADLRAALTHALQAAVPTADAPALTDRLETAFRTPAGVLEADAETLFDAGVPAKGLATLLSLTPELARYRAWEEAKRPGALYTIATAGPFLSSLYLGEHYESCHLTAIADTGALARCVCLQTGTVNETPFYARVIVEQALRSGVKALLLSHNHPGGAEFASQADMENTSRILMATHEVGLCLIDHIIVADGKPVSMRFAGTPEKRLWNRYAPLQKPFTNWL